MILAVLRSGVDTLEASFLGDVAEELPEKLDALKVRAQESGLAQPFAHTGLHVQAKAFGFWRWRLTEPGFELRLSPAAAPGRPSASIRLSALGLATNNVQELYERATAALRVLGDFNEYGLSRLDVFADFQGWVPNQTELVGMSCAAPYRGLHGTAAEAQTFQYGKGDVVLRLYNKTAEIAHSKKSWVEETWRDSGAWDREACVWRAEVQVRTKVLGELGLRSVRAALASPGALFDWVLCEWCQLRVPNGDKKVTRWPEHPAWSRLRASVFDGQPVARATRKAQLLPLEDAARRLVGLVATAGAHYGEDSFIKTLQQLSYRTEAYMLSEHIDFAELVAAKRKRLVAEIGDEWENVPF